MSKNFEGRNAVGDTCPEHLADINRELSVFARNFGRIVARQKRKGFNYALSSESVPSISQEFKILESDVRRLSGFKEYAAARDAYLKRHKGVLREMVIVEDRDGETDIVVGVFWNADP